MEPLREKIAAAFMLTMILGICAMIMTGCRRETPTADRATRTASDSSASNEAAKQEAPSPHPTITDEAFERKFVETFERASRPTVATDTTQPLRRAPTHIVHFASPAIPLQVFRVDDHPPITVDGMTYRTSRYAFVAIDIADVMRSERACLFVDRQPRLTAGTCFWPATWGRGKWMVVPVDTSPVVQFRRRSGPNILPAMKIADLPAISAAELK